MTNVFDFYTPFSVPSFLYILLRIARARALVYSLAYSYSIRILLKTFGSLSDSLPVYAS
jgi:hypothetical protein